MTPGQVDALKRDEGLRLHPYIDTVGKTSIGYGRNLTDNGIRLAEADMLLNNDINSAMTDCSIWPWYRSLDPVRKGVIEQLVFNMGPYAVSGFRRMIACIERGDYAGASDELLASEWARQVQHERSARLAAQLSGGTDGLATGA